MFTFKSYLDNAVKGSKTALNYVSDKDLRSSLESIVDAQAEFAQSLFDSSLEIAKIVVEKSSESVYTKPFADVAKKAMAEVK